MSYGEQYSDAEYYGANYYNSIGGRRSPVPLIISGCIGAILGFTCTICFGLGLLAILLPPTFADATAPQAADKPENATVLQQFSGTGKQASPRFTLSRGVAILRITHDGNDYFKVSLLDSNGNQVFNSNGVAPIVNEKGAFDGSIAVSIQQEGVYLLDVTADGYWTVTIEQ
jgi:hypothetical protein